MRWLFAALLAHAEKRRRETRASGGSKEPQAARNTTPPRASTAPLRRCSQKSRTIRNEANKAAAKAGCNTGRAARAKVNSEVRQGPAGKPARELRRRAAGSASARLPPADRRGCELNGLRLRISAAAFFFFQRRRVRATSSGNASLFLFERRHAWPPSRSPSRISRPSA